MEALKTIIARGEEGPKPVPPGIYAEYGYGLFKMGQYANAIEYFEKEKSLWLESSPMMDKVIGNVRSVMNKDK